MREAVLRDFFLGKATAVNLRADLNAAVIGDGMMQRQAIVEMPDDYLVTCQDLLKLCDVILAKDLPSGALENIAFCLIASDHFEWDSDDPDGKIVADTVADWAAPEINYALTLENVRIFRERLHACVSKNYNP